MLDKHKRLNCFRKYIDVNQKRIAVFMGCSEGMYRRYEKGITDIPISKLDQLVNQYNLNLNWLLTGKGEMLLNPDLPSPAIVAENKKLRNENRNLKAMLWDNGQEIRALKKNLTDLEELDAKHQERSDFRKNN